MHQYVGYHGSPNSTTSQPCHQFIALPHRTAIPPSRPEYYHVCPNPRYVHYSGDTFEFMVEVPFMFFSLIAQFLMLNLFVMVIVEGYEVIDDDCRSKTEDDITPFQYHWSEFDPDATGYITVEQLPGLVKLLPPPLGCGGEDNPKLVQLIVKRVVEIPG